MPAQEVPASLIDGLTTTKWTDTNFHGESIVQFRLAAAEHVDAYELITSTGDNNANHGRDPTGWEFGILRTTGAFEVLSTITGMTPPTGRATSYGRLSSLYPPSPPSAPLPPSVPPAPSGTIYLFNFT
eukprot:2108189-Prymnesium_polylepis.1